MIVYRISSCKFITDLSGKGAALYGGRWNNKDTYIVYTAQSAALALLETVVHFGRLPDMGFCMISIELPVTPIETYPVSSLPADWYSNPAPDHLKQIGDRFVASGKNLALRVPSVIMPEESNLLLNPRHSDFEKVKILTNRPLNIDERLLHHNTEAEKMPIQKKRATGK